MKIRHLSTIVMIALIVVLCGLGTYVVYAAVSVSLNATNRIVFNADQSKIFYTASVKVHYQDSTDIIAEDSINHSGELGKQDLQKTQIVFDDAISFVKNDEDVGGYKNIIYEIFIANYTEQDIQVKVNPHKNTTYFTNSLNENQPVCLTKYEAGNNPKTVTFQLTTTLASNQYSFKYDNSFSVDLTLVNS